MRTLILGLDAFDPTLFEQLSGDGRLPHLARYADAGHYRRLAITQPAQSEVSWTSIATGLNPGGHGLFDFVHRRPQSYALGVSLLPTRSGLAGTQFVPPFNAATLFDYAVRQGYPATSLWWPATFPARPQTGVRTIPGLGTPDILGQLGVGTYLSPDEALPRSEGKSRVGRLVPEDNGRFHAEVAGPLRRRRGTAVPATLPLSLQTDADGHAQLTIAGQTISLVAGQWSPLFTLRFKMGLLLSVTAVTRVLWSTDPTPHLYFLPWQIHPLKSPWPYGTPGRFVKALWQKNGPFLTLGWPQDTTALEDGCISDAQFLALADDIVTSRERLLNQVLDDFGEGVVGVVLDTLDRVQHMFWGRRPDVIAGWYERLDALVGRIEARFRAKGDDQLLILSDHGFTAFDHKVHLNRWLLDAGYLAATSPDAGTWTAVDWPRTQAYAIGLNSVYLNIAGREGQGKVNPQEATALRAALRDQLLAWRDDNGGAPVQSLLTNEEAFDGPLAEHGPDLVIGYASGYRASAETGLGGWGPTPLTPNLDVWAADHCVDATAVPGVLFARQGLAALPHPTYRDIPGLAVGATPDAGASKPAAVDDVDDAALRERLKGLGYL